VNVGDEVEVMVLEIDEERRRISLGVKQCQSNPWAEFSASFKKGDTVTGTIKSITDFGIFIGLPGGIDGLVHLSDISWDEESDESARNYSKGEEVETIVLAIDPERERISLGIKQLDKDPLSAFLAEHPKGSIITGTVKEVDVRGAVVTLAEGIEGNLRASELSRERVEDARTVLKEGEEIEARLIGLDRKNRVISLSIKAKEAHEEAVAVESYKTDSAAVASGTTLGDLLKEQMGDDES
jgi:small subunit ribosomal protein S1